MSVTGEFDPMQGNQQPAGQGALLSFRDEEVKAQRASYKGRGYALIGVAILTGILSPWPAPVYIWALLALFFANGYLAYRATAADWGRPWHQYVIVFFDFALLTFTLIYPNPLSPVDFPPQINLRFGNFIYFFILLASLAYIYKPRLVIWGGICGAVTWVIGVLYLLSLPNAKWRAPTDGDLDAYLDLISDVHFVDLGVRLQEVAVFLLTAGLIAVGVTRIRAIALRQIEFARQRENLARYFPNQTADYLAEKSNPFTTPREQHAAVLFADVVGFTTWAESRQPEQIIAYLRQTHQLLAEIIFKWNGTLDKFVGDGVMASFGTPEPTGRDASNALLAALEMADSYEEMRRTLTAAQGGDLKLSIGLQFGAIVVGDVGSKDRLEFATLGDVVNVASRLEAATRDHDCRVLVGEAVIIEAAKELGKDATELVARLERIEPIAIRGRAAKESTYCYR